MHFFETIANTDNEPLEIPPSTVCSLPFAAEVSLGEIVSLNEMQSSNQPTNQDSLKLAVLFGRDNHYC